MEVNLENVNDFIINSWNSIKDKVENGSQPLSSEKTLVFAFAMELRDTVGSNLIVDFEAQCYDSLQGDSKYLDLLFYTNSDFKVAVEFKFPCGTPDQKSTRNKIYRDLGRLNFLKKNSTYNSYYFLMSTNVDSFLNKGDYKFYPEMITSHNHSINQNNSIIVDGASLNGLSARFSWQNIEEKTNKTNDNKKYIRSGNYAWLSPIKV